MPLLQGLAIGPADTLITFLPSSCFSRDHCGQLAARMTILRTAVCAALSH